MKPKSSPFPTTNCPAPQTVWPGFSTFHGAKLPGPPLPSGNTTAIPSLSASAAYWVMSCICCPDIVEPWKTYTNGAGVAGGSACGRYMRYERLAAPTVTVCMVNPRIPAIIPQLAPPLDDEPVELDDDEPVELDDDEPVELDDDEPVELDDEPVELDDDEPVELDDD